MDILGLNKDHPNEGLLSVNMGLTNPPIEEFGAFFVAGSHHGKNNVPAAIIKFDIALLSLAEEGNLNDQKGIDYIAAFLKHYCPESKSYNALAKEGQNRIDSIFKADFKVTREAVKRSGCNS